MQLFERGRRGVLLTPAGAELLPQLKRLLRSSELLAESARRLKDPLAGPLRLGVIPTIAPYLLPRLDPALRAAFPKLSPRWREAQTADLVGALHRGEMDAALLAAEAELPGLQTAALGQDPFLLATAASEPPAAEAPIPLSALSGARVLLLSEGHCLREQALSLCGASGAEEQAFGATSLSTLVQLVAAGEGLTLLPELSLAVENREQQLRIQRFQAPEPTRTIVFAWREGSPLGSATRALAEIGAQLLRSAEASA